MSSLRFTLLPFALLAVLAQLHAQDTARYTANELPVDVRIERDGTTWIGCRVVDDLTGAPVAGAELFLVDELETPLPDRFWSSRRVVADPDGFVRTRADDVEWDWLVLRTPGLGPSTNMNAPADQVWRLGRSLDVPVRVRDWLGRPVAGARIGLCGGCGHSPDLANATTDADGVAVLRGIDPHNDIADVYVQHASIDLGYQGIHWQPGEPAAEVACGPSPRIRGVLVDAAGVPVAGAFLGTRDVHRGPWAETDARGRFELLGARPGNGVVAVLPGGREVWFTNDAGWPATLRLPPAGSDENEGTVVPPAAVPMPAAAAPVRVAVRWAEGAAVQDLRVSLRVEGREKEADVTEIMAAGGSVEVPPGTPFALLVHGDSVRRFVTFVDHAAAAAVAPVALRPFAPTVVRARAVGPDGEPAAVRAAIEPLRHASFDRGSTDDLLHDAPRAADGRVELRVERSGAAALLLAPDGDLLPRVLFVQLPPRGDDAALDLGDVRLARAPRLRVLGVDGEPALDVHVGWARPGFQGAGAIRSCSVRADGAFVGPDLAAGDAILVMPDAADDVAGDPVPFRTVLAGDGPWTIHVPGGRLAFAIRDDGGEPCDATVYVADRFFETDGDLELRTLPPGPLRLFVAAEGSRGVVVDCTVPATGCKSLVLTLTEPAPTLTEVR